MEVHEKYLEYVALKVWSPCASVGGQNFDTHAGSNPAAATSSDVLDTKLVAE